MASLRSAGHAGGVGRYRSSASSTRRRDSSRNASSVSVVTSRSAVGFVAREPGGRRLELAAFVQQLDPAFGVLEPCVTELGQGDAAFVEGQRLLERQFAFFELFDDGLELRDSGFEVLDRGVAHPVRDTLASIAPRLKVTWTVSPGDRSAASRIARVRSSFQQTA